MTDVVFTFTFDSWADAVRREMQRPHDRLLMRLLDDDRVANLVVVDSFRSVAGFVRERLRGHAVPRSPKVRAHVRPVKGWRGEPTTEGNAAALYARYDREVGRAVRRAGLSRPAVVTTNPLVAGFAPLEWAGPVTYYARDDWSAHAAYEASWPSIAAAYDAMRQRKRRVVAVSRPLLERLAPTGAAAVIPNGVLESEWTTPEPAPSWFDAIAEPRALYLGTLHDFRFDAPLVRAAAEHLPDVSFVLVGPASDSSHLDALRSMPNVHVHPRVERREATALVWASQVCLIPNRVSPLTEAMSPLKLYEYAAAGKPIVTVDLPGCDVDVPAVFRVPPGAPFHAAIRRALEAPRPSEADRERFVDENSWERRHDALLDLALADDDLNGSA